MFPQYRGVIAKAMEYEMSSYEAQIEDRKRVRDLTSTLLPLTSSTLLPLTSKRLPLIPPLSIPG
eukprot:528374-Pyramimonas_sp.AAC.2